LQKVTLEFPPCKNRHCCQARYHSDFTVSKLDFDPNLAHCYCNLKQCIATYTHLLQVMFQESIYILILQAPNGSVRGKIHGNFINQQIHSQSGVIMHHTLVPVIRLMATLFRLVSSREFISLKRIVPKFKCLSMAKPEFHASSRV
jgi:hypothetical protein